MEGFVCWSCRKKRYSFSDLRILYRHTYGDLLCLARTFPYNYQLRFPIVIAWRSRLRICCMGVFSVGEGSHMIAFIHLISTHPPKRHVRQHKPRLHCNDRWSPLPHRPDAPGKPFSLQMFYGIIAKVRMAQAKGVVSEHFNNFSSATSQTILQGKTYLTPPHHHLPQASIAHEYSTIPIKDISPFQQYLEAFSPSARVYVRQAMSRGSMHRRSPSGSPHDRATQDVD